MKMHSGSHSQSLKDNWGRLQISQEDSRGSGSLLLTQVRGMKRLFFNSLYNKAETTYYEVHLPSLLRLNHQVFHPKPLVGLKKKNPSETMRGPLRHPTQEN